MFPKPAPFEILGVLKKSTEVPMKSDVL